MTQDSVFAPRYRALSVGVLMGVTIVAFQALGVGTAMPAIARELGGLRLYGWSFSAFMLASIVGTVAAGRAADAGGPARPYLASVGLFAAGSLVGALAGSWGMLLAGRAIQGLGVGALIVVIYVSASRAYPDGHVRAHARADVDRLGAALARRPGARGRGRRPRELALGVRRAAPAACPSPSRSRCPALRTLDRPAAAGPRRSLGPALVLTAGVGGFLAALELREPLLLVPAAAAGIAVAGLALRRLLPPGTLRARAGLPAGRRGARPRRRRLPRRRRVHAAGPHRAARVQLHGRRRGHHRGIAELEPRRVRRRPGRTSGTAGAAAAGARGSGSRSSSPGSRSARSARWSRALPVALAVVGWMVAGFGIGIAYPSVGALVLAQAADGEEGLVSSALQLAETVGVARLRRHRRRAHRRRARQRVGRGHRAGARLRGRRGDGRGRPVGRAPDGRAGRGGPGRLARAGDRVGRSPSSPSSSPLRPPLPAPRALTPGKRSGEDRGEHPGGHDGDHEHREGDRHGPHPGGRAGLRAEPRRLGAPAPEQLARGRLAAARARARRAGRRRGSPARRSRRSGARARARRRPAAGSGASRPRPGGGRRRPARARPPRTADAPCGRAPARCRTLAARRRSAAATTSGEPQRSAEALAPARRRRRSRGTPAAPPLTPSSTSSAASATAPSAIRQARTSASSPATPTIMYSDVGIEGRG